MTGAQKAVLLATGAAVTWLLAYKVVAGRAQAFVMKATDDAKKIAAEFGLPTWLTLTQSAHESAMGKSGLTAKANNLFGFSGGSWVKKGLPVVAMPTTEWINGRETPLTKPFRAYADWYESMKDWATQLTTMKQYAPAVARAKAGDVAGTFAALGKSGYATDPNYGTKLTNVYKQVQPYLV